MKLKDFADTQFYITDYRCIFYVIKRPYAGLDNYRLLTINNYEELKDREILYWYVDGIKGDVITIKVCLI